MTRPSPCLRPCVRLRRPLVFNGSRLFVNAFLADGASELRLEVLDARDGTDGATALCGMGWGEARPLRGVLDSTRAQLPAQWRGGARLEALAGRRVRLRFVLSGAARLYSFWITHSATGASGGFLGGGAFGVRGVQDEEELYVSRLQVEKGRLRQRGERRS